MLLLLLPSLLPLPLSSIPLLRRILLADGAEIGISSPKPFAVFSRPCLRDCGESRDSVAPRSSLPMPSGVVAFSLNSIPKKGCIGTPC